VILLLITDLEIGGTPTVVRELAVRLKKQGVDVEVACLGGRGPVADQIEVGGVPVHVLGACCAADIRVFIRLGRLVRRQKYNTILSFLAHANVAAALATLGGHGVRLIQSIQTTQPKPRWHWWAQSVAGHWTDKIVVPSQSVADVARTRCGIAPEKITVIPNAVDIDAFAPSPSPGTPGEVSGIGDCPRAGWVGGIQAGRRIGFLGRLDPIKRIGDLIDAMTFLPDGFTLHIFGEGSERAALTEQVRRLGLSARVTLHGRTDAPQDALLHMDCLVLPSDAEGFGLVLIEAMAAGIPVVATDAPGIRNVVRHNQTGLLVPCRSPAALAQAIATLASDPALRRRLVESARQDVKDRFVWEPVLRQYRQLLEGH